MTVTGENLSTRSKTLCLLAPRPTHIPRGVTWDRAKININTILILHRYCKH